MKLTKEQIKAIALGALDVTETEGYIRFHRFTAEERTAVINPNLDYPAGVQLICRTDGTSLVLSGRTISKTGVRSYYTFDIYENGSRIGTITNLQDEDAVGSYATQTYPVGDFSASFPLGPGEKELRIVIPHSVLAEISELTITDAAYVLPVTRKKRLVAYGDSITQGYDALHPSNTYPMRLAEALGAELFNKGLGGVCFTPAMGAAPSGVQADAVLVAYGTNDWNHFDRDTFTASAAGFFENLVRQYGDTPIYAITPIWRGDHLEKVPPFGPFADLEEVIRTVCQPWPTVQIISGMPLVPHDAACFGDLYLHPNDTGFAAYAAHLLEKIGTL